MLTVASALSLYGAYRIEALGNDALLGVGFLEQTGRRLDKHAVVAVHESGKAELASEDDRAAAPII